jgi:predicted extracellular nuclease
MQDPNPDANDATSEGIFVFTSSAPTRSVGDSVLVSGTVSEFAPGGGSNLSITQIVSPTVLVQSTGNPLPPPTIIGSGGRVPPDQVIYSGAQVDLNTQPHVLSMLNGVDFYESLEGMRVQVNDTIAVGPTNPFGETPVVANLGINANVMTPRATIVVRSNDFNPERIIVKEAPGTGNRYAAGTKLGNITGVLTYLAGNYMLLRDQSVPLNPDTTFVPLPESTTLAPVPSRLTVASFVMSNLDPGDGAAKFAAIANGIVTGMKSPDIIVALEVQDNNGGVNDSTVDASTTLGMLVGAIAAAGGPSYQTRSIDPVDDQDGGEPGGNGRIVFLYNPARVGFIDRAGGNATTPTVINNAGGTPQLSVSPGRVDPGNMAWNNTRKPLAGEFAFAGKTVFVVAAHFVSKGGDTPLFGRNQPPILSSETLRNQQAGIVQGFVASILAVDANARVIVAGDFNDFEFSAPLTTLKGTNLHNLTDNLAQNQRYTFVFDGNAQALDHILVSDALFAGAEYDIVHVNSEYPTALTDHDLPLARLGIGPSCVLDLDANGSLDPLTDGLMLHRVLSGMTGDAVTANAVGAGANRDTWAEIAPFVNLPALDVDGNGVSAAASDGLAIMRAMFGLKGTAVTAGAIAPGTPRDNWEAIRLYLNSACGASFSP